MGWMQRAWARWQRKRACRPLLLALDRLEKALLALGERDEVAKRAEEAAGE